MFVKEFAKVLGEEHELSDTDFTVLLTFLARDKRAIAYDGKTVKFGAPNGAITAEDATIASLRSIIADLSHQVSALTSRIGTLSAAARIAVAEKNRVSALAYLRSKKLAETALTQRSEMLGQLEQVYVSIEQAADQVDVVRIMEASTAVLKGLHAEVGGVERVEDVVDELKEQMYKVDEVGKIISEAGDTGLIVDDGEVDDELEAMEQEEKEKRDKAKAQEVEARLTALDRDKDGLAKIAEEGERKQQEDVEAEKGTEEAIAALEGLSLEESRTMPEPEKGDSERSTILAT
ncbi:hypothetical protein GP486_008042 [Trichoglossum hirsutum]|uniref:SNF7 family protein n=1 Tax=Trichoglossum hirsutum TaxID=265104 RepID=A0A9P8IJ12_9PEZI|nr:hypothetical protein GP486_008042 [Trichoglossum hirsutum]